MDYIAKMNLQRLELNNNQLYNEYVQFVRDNMAKVTTRHYELMQAQKIARTFINKKELPDNLFYRLRNIAFCYYRIAY